MEQMRERVARAIGDADDNFSAANPDSFSTREGVSHWATALADAALSLMQPEIDRRVAEEKAKLLERLRVPSEGMMEEGVRAPACHWDFGPRDAGNIWQAMLDAFVKEEGDDQG